MIISILSLLVIVVAGLLWAGLTSPNAEREHYFEETESRRGT